MQYKRTLFQEAENIGPNLCSTSNLLYNLEQTF
jgi:hypothetical protein